MALLELNFKSFNIMKAVRLTIILPCDDGFPSEEPPYKTLYLLNNYSANSSEMTTMMNLRNTSIRTGLAFVLIGAMAGSGIAVYFIAALVMPEAEAAEG